MYEYRHTGITPFRCLYIFYKLTFARPIAFHPCVLKLGVVEISALAKPRPTTTATIGFAGFIGATLGAFGSGGFGGSGGSKIVKNDGLGCLGGSLGGGLGTPGPQEPKNHRKSGFVGPPWAPKMEAKID